MEMIEPDRLIGTYGGTLPGRNIVLIAGMHGNEPEGIIACRRVLDRLENEGLPLHGKLTAVMGNRNALGAGKRFIDVDLNRLWDDRSLENILSKGPDESFNNEEHELPGLFRLFETLATEPRNSLVIDLHTTSSPGSPFTVVAPDISNYNLAAALYAPVVIGLVNKLGSTCLSYLMKRGIPAIAFEGGKQGTEAAIQAIEAAIWLSLVHEKSLESGDVPHILSAINRLKEAAQGLPPFVKVVYRHAIKPGDEFNMNVGYNNFKKIRNKEYLARDLSGNIPSPCDGWILMPLYQSQGEDGFFIVQETQGN